MATSSNNKDNTKSDEGPSLKKAQRLRLQRTLWACVPLSVLLLCVLLYVHLGLVPAARALEYLIIIVFCWGTFFTLILSGQNLRFTDPSMTVAQTSFGILTQLYIMFFLVEPLARVPFLLLGTVNMMFAVFALDLRRMLLLNVAGVSAYALMVAFKGIWYPVGLADWRIEVSVVVAFMVAVAMNAYIGSVITRLRDRLRNRNQALESAMIKLEDLATRDALTRLPNRHSVMKQLSREEARYDRKPTAAHTLCLCMVDVDYFKQINDQFGHTAGDTVLSWLGDQLRRALRESDFVGRFGGEEFLVLLPDTGLEDARDLMHRLRQRIAEADPPGLPAELELTISAGIAVHPCEGDIQDTLKRADDALYQAKDQGRNRIIVAE